jgi:hypothetical protein
MPDMVVLENLSLRKRFDDYLGYGRRNMQLDEDIWQRWQEDRLGIGSGALGEGLWMGNGKGNGREKKTGRHSEGIRTGNGEV